MWNRFSTTVDVARQCLDIQYRSIENRHRVSLDQVRRSPKWPIRTDIILVATRESRGISFRELISTRDNQRGVPLSKTVTLDPLDDRDSRSVVESPRVIRFTPYVRLRHHRHAVYDREDRAISLKENFDCRNYVGRNIPRVVLRLLSLLIKSPQWNFFIFGGDWRQLSSEVNFQ